MSKDGFCRTYAYDAAKQHVDDGNRVQLFSVKFAAQMSGQEGTAPARDPGPARLDRAGTFLGVTGFRLLLLRHHRGNAPAARRAIEQSDRWRLQLKRQLVQITALAADGAVRMSAPRGKVVRADNGRASVDLSPAADVVGGREGRDPAVLVIRGEAGKTAHLTERVFIQQQGDAVPAGQFTARTLSDDAGVIGTGCEAGMCQLLQGFDFVEHRRPGLIDISFSEIARRIARIRRDLGHDLSRHDFVSHPHGLYRSDRARAWRRDRGFHLHGADDKQRIAGVYAAAFNQ